MHKLQECTNLTEAAPFLRGRSESFKKVVETAFLLRNQRDPQQRTLGDSYMAIAIRELEDAEKPAEHNDDGLKTKGEHFVKEEELAGGDKSGTEGSEQSSKNSEPVTSLEGTTEPDGDMQTPVMSTENQFNEAFPPMPGMSPPGLDPNIAQQMAPQMPPMPPMNTPQQVQQMQYTVKEALKQYVRPLHDQVVRLTKANSFLSNQIKEMKTNSMGLDVNKIVNEGKIPRLQETTIPTAVHNVNPDAQISGGARIYEKQYKQEKARQDIIDIDNMIANSGNHPYQ